MAVDISRAMAQRTLVLDGAMGTMIQKLGLTEDSFRGDMFSSWHCNLAGCNDLLNLTRPSDIAAIHRSYMEAGADIIETNTFNSTSVSLGDYGLGTYASQINLEGARIARTEADAFMQSNPGRTVWVAGSVGPTNKSLSMAASLAGEGEALTWDVLYNAYRDQISALVNGGVDVLLIETVFDTLNAKAAIKAALDIMDLSGRDVPIMVSVTLTENGRTLSGQTLEAFVASVAHARPLSVGLNCGFGADRLIPYIDMLASMPFGISMHPNAGLPDRLGQYDCTPQSMAESLAPVLAAGKLNIVGGCCGTTPCHIRDIAELAHVSPSRPIPCDDGGMHLSGLEAVTVPQYPDSLFKIGERCNVAGSRKFLRLIKEGKIDEAVDIARSQILAGAQVVDVNVDDAMLDAPAEMARFLDALASDAVAASVPVMIDSSSWDVVSVGLCHLQGHGIVNSISLKDGEDEFLRRARHIRSMGASVVVMAMDETGQADTFQRKVDVVRRSYRLLMDKAGFRPADMIFDPNVLAVATGVDAHNGYGKAFIDAAREIKALMPGVHVSGGLSNLSFSFRGNNFVREAMHAEFLSLASGLDMAIVNPSSLVGVDSIPSGLRHAIRDVLLDSDSDAPARLLDVVAALQPDVTADSKASVGRKPEARPTVAEMIVRGRHEGIEESLQEAISSGMTAMEIVEKLLMEGMNEVGRLFADGRMFLPQVVKSAQAMKYAVGWLAPYIEAERESQDNAPGGSLPKAVIATVKGDVHDIGKNIVSIILRCNGFEVEDLGVMVSAERIIASASVPGIKMVCLSGLITPSLAEMAHVASQMEKAGLHMPLFVGGAAASELHTAVKIAPLYSSPVFYTHDAATLPVVARSWLNPATRFEVVRENTSRQESLRESMDRPIKMLSLPQADSKRPEVRPWEYAAYPHGVSDFSYHIADLRRYINWRPFFIAWKLDGSLASVADVQGCGHCMAQWLAGMPEHKRAKAAEAMQLYKEAGRALDRLEACLEEAGGSIRARVVFVAAGSCGNDIVLSGGAERVVMPTLRQQEDCGAEPRLAMSDFIGAAEAHDGFLPDTAAVFAVTAGGCIQSEIEDARNSGDEYRSLLYQSLADRLAEAATELTHQRVSAGLGIRPAIGYQSLPDQSLVFEADKILGYGDVGITLTDTGAMYPQASTTGIMIFNPDARYFSVGRIGKDQLADYAARRGMTPENARRFIGSRVVD